MSSKKERCRTRDTQKEEGKIEEEILAHGLEFKSINLRILSILCFQSSSTFILRSGSQILGKELAVLKDLLFKVYVAYSLEN